MIVGQLRDGRRMLFLSGSNVVLIDLLNGLGDRSCVFDRFRKRALDPLVEVHFSRSRSLTAVVSGASLFAFDGTATHHPPLSVTDAEAAIDRRPQGLNQLATLRRAGQRSAMRTPILSRRGVIECTVGDREDSTTNYNVLLNASTRIDR
jgi:hypothetical protein